MPTGADLGIEKTFWHRVSQMQGHKQDAQPVCVIVVESCLARAVEQQGRGGKGRRGGLWFSGVFALPSADLREPWRSVLHPDHTLELPGQH